MSQKSVVNIQAMYDAMSRCSDVSVSARNPLMCKDVQSCLDAMNKVSLHEIGLSEDDVPFLKDNMCMDIFSSSNFNIAVFIIPSGHKLPLHDHPGMAVLSKLICGRMRYTSFSPCNSQERRTRDTLYQYSSISKSEQDPAWFLTPQEGNFHEIEAEETCVMLDVLFPPYEPPQRECTYYRAVQQHSGLWRLETTEEPDGLPYAVQYPGYKPVRSAVGSYN